MFGGLTQVLARVVAIIRLVKLEFLDFYKNIRGHLALLQARSYSGLSNRTLLAILFLNLC
jgi:hypothetical protein